MYQIANPIKSTDEITFSTALFFFCSTCFITQAISLRIKSAVSFESRWRGTNATELLGEALDLVHVDKSRIFRNNSRSIN